MLAGALVGAWGLAAVLVLLAYRPGGPLDVAVGITMLVPLTIAVSGFVWPPVARGRDTYPMVVALGVGSLLLLLPSIGGVLNQLQALGSQTLMPSLEAAYPWLLALAGTSLFAGFGLARRLDAGTALRPRRLVVGTLVAICFTAVAGTSFAGAAIANEIALRGRTTPPAVSRFGPTDAEAELPACGDRLETGRTARLIAHLRGTVDGRAIGSVDLCGPAGRDRLPLARLRGHATASWASTGARARRAGLGRARRRRLVPTADARRAGEQTLDLQAVAHGPRRPAARPPRTAGSRSSRAPGRGTAASPSTGRRSRAAFPQIRWLVGDADLSRWRGQLDYWVFLDGQLGQVAGSVNGEAGGIEPGRPAGDDRGPADGDGSRRATWPSILRVHDLSRTSPSRYAASAIGSPGCSAS